MKKILKKAISNFKSWIKTPLAIGMLSNIVLMAYSFIGYMLFYTCLTKHTEAMPIVIYFLLWAFPTDQFLTVTSYKFLKRMVKDYETETESSRD